VHSLLHPLVYWRTKSYRDRTVCHVRRPQQMQVYYLEFPSPRRTSDQGCEGFLLPPIAQLVCHGGCVMPEHAPKACLGHKAPPRPLAEARTLNLERGHL